MDTEKPYEKLNGKSVLLGKLTARETEALTTLTNRAKQNPDVLDFTLFRMKIISDLYGRREYNNSIMKPIFQVAQDLGQRLDYQQNPNNDPRVGAKNDRSRSTDKSGRESRKTVR